MNIADSDNPSNQIRIIIEKQNVKIIEKRIT